MKIRERELNYELLRIVSMFMIVIYHFLIHGYIIDNTTGMLHFFLRFIEIILIVHVNSFVLVTGYYQCESKFRMGKLLSLNNSVWFYKVIIALIVVFTGMVGMTKIDLVKNLLPLNYGTYWFMGIYILLYMTTPILNHIIKNIDKKTYKRILLILLVIFSILPTISNGQIFDNHYGYSLGNFIFLYFVGAYYRKYPIHKSYLFKKLTKNARALILMISFFALALINFLLFTFAFQISSWGAIAEEISLIISSATYSYNNPLVILGSVCFFLWFGTLSIKSKWIGKISTYTLGVYLIHDNRLLYDIVYPFFHLRNNMRVESYMIVTKVIIYAFLVFVICIFIEWFRKTVFTFIYNRKISKKIRESYRNYIDSLNIHINW